jgi:hypothetical protein
MLCLLHSKRKLLDHNTIKPSDALSNTSLIRFWKSDNIPGSDRDALTKRLASIGNPSNSGSGSSEPESPAGADSVLSGLSASCLASSIFSYNWLRLTQLNRSHYQRFI